MKCQAALREGQEVRIKEMERGREGKGWKGERGHLRKGGRLREDDDGWKDVGGKKGRKEGKKWGTRGREH